MVEEAQKWIGREKLGEARSCAWRAKGCLDSAVIRIPAETDR